MSMQKGFFVLFLSFLFSLMSVVATAQSERFLVQADSMFASGKYVEALGIYEHLLTKNSLYSPQMLLKMAFIEESKGDYPKALYYLNLYYRLNPDKQILRKLEEIANTNRLEGYQYTDKTYFLALYDANKWYIISALGLIVVAMGVWLVSRIRQKRLITPPLVVGLSAVLLLLVLHNFATQRTMGIVKNDYTVLASAPSAAAKVIEVVPKGTRYEITDKTDSWYQVELGDKKGFIRLHNTLVVR